jgi:SsrA-binding protein
MGNHMNHKRKRARKVLLHRREIAKFADRADQRGFSLIPLRLYFKNGRAKVELALCKGKQLHDKRQSLKQADANREIKRELARHRRG